MELYIKSISDSTNKKALKQYIYVNFWLYLYNYFYPWLYSCSILFYTHCLFNKVPVKKRNQKKQNFSPMETAQDGLILSILMKILFCGTLLKCLLPYWPYLS